MDTTCKIKQYSHMDFMLMLLEWNKKDIFLLFVTMEKHINKIEKKLMSMIFISCLTVTAGI